MKIIGTRRATASFWGNGAEDRELELPLDRSRPLGGGAAGLSIEASCPFKAAQRAACTGFSSDESSVLTVSAAAAGGENRTESEEEDSSAVSESNISHIRFRVSAFIVIDVTLAKKRKIGKRRISRTRYRRHVCCRERVGGITCERDLSKQLTNEQFVTSPVL